MGSSLLWSQVVRKQLSKNKADWELIKKFGQKFLHAKGYSPLQPVKPTLRYRRKVSKAYSPLKLPTGPKVWIARQSRKPTARIARQPRKYRIVVTPPRKLYRIVITPPEGERSEFQWRFGTKITEDQKPVSKRTLQTEQFDDVVYV